MSYLAIDNFLEPPFRGGIPPVVPLPSMSSGSFRKNLRSFLGRPRQQGIWLICGTEIQREEGLVFHLETLVGGRAGRLTTWKTLLELPIPLESLSRKVP